MSSTSCDGRSNGLRHSILVAGSCLLWLVCSTSIVLVNRSIIVNDFPYPIAVSCLGQCTSFLVAGLVILNSGTRTTPGRSNEQEEAGQARPPDTHDTTVSWRFWLARVLPIGVAQGLGVWIANLLYLLLTVAFIEMARSLMPLLTLLALWASGLQVPSHGQVAAVALSAVGCGISAYGEAKLVLSGVLVLSLSFTLEVARMLLLQYLMQERKMGVWQSIWTVAGPSAGTLVTIMCLLEGRDLVTSGAGSVVKRDWPSFVSAACLGVTSVYLTNLIIQLSSATTVKLLSAIRGPLIVLSGMLLYAEPVAQIQLLGYSIALAGFVWYSLSPPANMEAKPSAPSEPPSAQQDNKTHKGLHFTFEIEDSERGDGETVPLIKTAPAGSA